MTGGGFCSAMRVMLSAGTLLTATACGRRITGASKLALPSCGKGLAAKILAYTVQLQPNTRLAIAALETKLLGLTFRAELLGLLAAKL
jgi:hypothetical protein